MSSDWKKYEKQIVDKLKTEFPKTDIKLNVKLDGIYSKIQRQVDILVKGTMVGKSIIGVIECKCFNKKIDVKIIDGFIGFLEDVQANMGILITNVGYTTGAFNRAMAKGIKIDIVEYIKLSSYHFDWDNCETCDFNGHYNEIYWGTKMLCKTDSLAVTIQVGHCSFCNTTHIKCEKCKTVISISDGDYDKDHHCSCENKYLVTSEYIGDGMNEDNFYLILGRKKLSFNPIKAKERRASL
ncbi:restriction endonuclease [Chitinophaga polysaccharea]|uniref:Restriction endonuclease n=1 Tax=Chitinophaga polysaccharea TaxID=1293035 RepID=A0A561PNC8_9BACT|nr:restriction endonuclease [Chitinophaga polysaccharea]TWF39615.1 restriction endonuclease [Chitinophaga polysaccharea]